MSKRCVKVDWFLNRMSAEPYKRSLRSCSQFGTGIDSIVRLTYFLFLIVSWILYRKLMLIILIFRTTVTVPVIIKRSWQGFNRFIWCKENFEIFGWSSYTKVIGSRSRSQKQKSVSVYCVWVCGWSDFNRKAVFVNAISSHLPGTALHFYHPPSNKDSALPPLDP